MNDEEEVWRRARDGSGEAFAELFRMHRDSVFRRAAAMLDQAHDAEDATAVAFFELWRRRRSVRVVNGTVLPWLLVTVANTARNQRRSGNRYRRLLASMPRDEAQDAESEAVEKIDAQVLGVRLRDALATLKPDDAALLVLTALDGLSVADAAQVIGVKPGTARMRLKRARDGLRAGLGSGHPWITRYDSEGELA
ncbi:MAG: RNA polymerase sigma factor [Microbacterium sp.]|jgi:RNA polymerase sigma-70 factor (ECF subfamily)|nr:RNA polymerase sigma factor [Microbacterium sp.]